MPIEIASVPKPVLEHAKALYEAHCMTQNLHTAWRVASKHKRELFLTQAFKMADKQHGK